MSRATTKKFSARTAFLLWPTMIGWLLCMSHSLADENEVIQRGKEIFTQQWVYESPALADLTAGLDPIVARRQLRGLPGDGLGPMHNATSCESCHAGGGAAGVDRNVTLLTLDPRTNLPPVRTTRDRAAANQRERNQVRQALLDLYPALLSPTGVLSLDVVVHEKSTRPFYDAIRDDIGKHVPGGAPDDWLDAQKRTSEAIAEQPVLAGRKGELDFYLSQRNSPPLFGLGLIDRISMSRMSMLAKNQNRRAEDGVTGRVGIGKFGWRAQTATLDRFVRGACAGELGLQLRRTPQPPDAADETYRSPGVDLEESEVFQLVTYVASIPPPIQQSQRPQDHVAAREGKRLFARIGCNTCHVETMYPAKGIFSDLLLHDMGDLLQAPAPAPLGNLVRSVPRMSIPRFPPPGRNRSGSPNESFGPSLAGYYGSPSESIPRPFAMARPTYPRFPRGRVPSQIIDTTDPTKLTWEALQREWRTPPLWGVADSAPYLHDGRATTLDAAIRWHGGEASQATTQYRSLEKADREKLIAFLASLRAPSKSVWQTVEQDIGPSYVSTEVRQAEQLQRMAETINAFD